MYIWASPWALPTSPSLSPSEAKPGAGSSEVDQVEPPSLRPTHLPHSDEVCPSSPSARSKHKQRSVTRVTKDPEALETPCPELPVNTGPWKMWKQLLVMAPGLGMWFSRKLARCQAVNISTEGSSLSVKKCLQVSSFWAILG